MTQRPLGPYTIEERLATGGMAEVFVATRSGPHGFCKRVALKRILPQFAKDPDFVQMFVAEARLAARLEHPNVVQVFDFGELSGDLVLAMELVVGTNVNRLLRRITTHTETVPLGVALHVASQTARALAYAHRARGDDGEPLGIVHRDVSPANILLTHTGHVKLSDFGIARVAGADTKTDEGHVRGKLGYMSPEQVMGKSLDGRSDVFTLATVFAEMLLAEPLFGMGSDLDVLLRIRDVDLRTLERTSRRVPQDVAELIRFGLTADSANRPSSAVFADAIDDIMRRRGIVRGPELTARMLQRMELVEPSESDRHALESGAKPTGLVDATLLSGTDTDQISSAVGMTAPPIYRIWKNGERQSRAKFDWAALQPGHSGEASQPVVGKPDASSKIIGPVSFPQLVQLITGGVVRANTPISKQSGPYSVASSFPELGRFVTSPALQWYPEELKLASRAGGLGAARLLPVIHSIASASQTGVLYLTQTTRRKKIYFVEGRPDFIASTDKNELLGEWLVASGACLRMEVEMALALLPRYGGRLGDALVGIGVLRPVELFRAISAQVRARYLEAFRWREGQWAFVPEARSEEETFPLGHDPRELMRDAVFEAHPEELEAALSPVREKVLVQVENPVVPLSAYRVPPLWRELLDVRGDSTFGKIMARESAAKSADPEEVYRAIYLGLSCNIVRAA